MLDELLRRNLLGTPKRLPPALFYDELGSTLFEAITRLPEYEVTRAGLRLLEAHRHEVVEGEDELALVELGPGAGRKARLLVEALRARQAEVHFTGVDISAEALTACRRNLEEVPGVRVDTIEAPYVEGLRRAAARRAPGRRLLVLFLGSNLSNFDRVEAQAFLRDVRACLSPEDALLLGVDLDKPAAQLLPAYDDALGVTAAFNRNALLRLNREWGADFDLTAFAHEARWNPTERRIEMHLRAVRPMTVNIPRLELTLRFAAGETIWTESSHRFRVEELSAWAEAAGFRVERRSIDEAWPFAQLRLGARSAT